MPLLFNDFPLFLPIRFCYTASARDTLRIFCYRQFNHPLQENASRPHSHTLSILIITPTPIPLPQLKKRSLYSSATSHIGTNFLLFSFQIGPTFLERLEHLYLFSLIFSPRMHWIETEFSEALITVAGNPSMENKKQLYDVCPCVSLFIFIFLLALKSRDAHVTQHSPCFSGDFVNATL